jgi:hypothetical protein
MRKIFFTFFIIVNLVEFTLGQDTANITLRPINEIKRMPTLDEGKIINDKIQDSIYNCEACKIIRNEYRAFWEKNIKKIDSATLIVKGLNEKNNGYFYYIIIECKPGKFDMKNCKRILLVRSDAAYAHCDYFNIGIGKESKSKIIFDGPSGEVWYYEDLKRVPN